ncbi:MAG: hypothetical protein IPJ85_12715 [Flavobacteriales bacterium]|nr:hypothetical protein [Flavobacteriales bacterium]
MRTNIFAAISVALALVASTTSQGQQFTNPGAQGWWHTVNAGTNPQPTRGVSMGNAGVGPYPSAFQVRGELTWTQTPEVFRTNAPTTASTYWRMFQGGTGAGNERGQLFADPSATHFNINAPQGHLRLHTNTVERMRVNASGSYTIGSFAAQLASGFVGVSPNSTLWSGGGPGPFSRLHLHDGTGPSTGSYRPWMKNGLTFTGNQDHGFLGQKAGAVDYTDMVLHWSDNPGLFLKIGCASSSPAATAQRLPVVHKAPKALRPCGSSRSGTMRRMWALAISTPPTWPIP